MHLTQRGQGIGCIQAAALHVQLVAGDVSLVCHPLGIQQFPGLRLAALGCFHQCVVNKLAACGPVHGIGRGQVCLLGKTDDEIRLPIHCKLIRQHRLDLTVSVCPRQGRRV